MGSTERSQTRQGAAVLRALQSSQAFRTPQEIHAQLRTAGERVGLTTVYRHLQSLTEDGSVDVIQTADGSSAYCYCGPSDHHHHIVCRTCGRYSRIECPELGRWTKEMAAVLGYAEPSHVLEVFGICDECRSRGHEIPSADAPGGRAGHARGPQESRTASS